MLNWKLLFLTDNLLSCNLDKYVLAGFDFDFSDNGT